MEGVEECIGQEVVREQESNVFTAFISSHDITLPVIAHFGFKPNRDIDELEGINHKTGKTPAI